MKGHHTEAVKAAYRMALGELGGGVKQLNPLLGRLPLAEYVLLLVWNGNLSHYWTYVYFSQGA